MSLQEFRKQSGLDVKNEQSRDHKRRAVEKAEIAESSNIVIITEIGSTVSRLTMVTDKVQRTSGLTLTRAKSKETKTE